MESAAYVLPDGLLLVLINEGAPRKVSFMADPGAWLPQGEGWRVRAWNADGKRLSEARLRSTAWRTKTPRMAAGEMMFYEITH